MLDLSVSAARKFDAWGNAVNNFTLLVILGVLCTMRFVDFFASVPAALGDKICRSPDLPRVVVVVLFVCLSIYLTYFNLGVVFPPVSSPSPKVSNSLLNFSDTKSCC